MHNNKIWSLNKMLICNTSAMLVKFWTKTSFMSWREAFRNFTM